MTGNILIGLGGLGTFLVGMIILTGGLRELSGGAMRRLLVRFTRSPWRGAAAGALMTAIIQSSSATTVTAVGFVGAGLLTFPQGLGIIFGANIGTTATGWLVALFGFKLQLGQIALILVLAGALVRLLGRGWLRPLGWAVAGFGLMFVGIDGMQLGLAQFEGLVTPTDFPQDTLFGRLQLVAIGVAITLVTQSSSAGVAAALVALAAGAVSFTQAAAMVIGMDIGTTFTAVVATFGGSVASRQTGYAHVVYNVLTGTLAFFLLGPFAALIGPWLDQDAAGNAQFALVGFHTAFNVLGVCLVLPFARPFAALIVWLVPERGPALLRRLDDRLLSSPAAAVEAAITSLGEISGELRAILASLLTPGLPRRRDATGLARIHEALLALRDFLEKIRTAPNDPPLHHRHLAAMHALDHLSRLSQRCARPPGITTLTEEPRLRRLSSLVRSAALAGGQAGAPAMTEQTLNRLRGLLRRQRRVFRQRTVDAAAQQRISADTTLSRLDAIRWLHRVAYHLWRIAHHMQRAEEQALTPADRTQSALDAEED